MEYRYQAARSRALRKVGCPGIHPGKKSERPPRPLYENRKECRTSKITSPERLCHAPSHRRSRNHCSTERPRG
jgi:hypothetical protein